MATITPQQASQTGSAVTYATASPGGDTIHTSGGRSQNVTLLVRNASGGSITVTLAGAVECSQGALHNATVTCAVGDTEIELPGHVIADDGTVAVTYSSATSVTVAAIAN